MVDGTEFVVVSVEAERRAARDVVPALIARLITGLQIPRGMRWGAVPEGAGEYLRFSRPIRWLVAKLGGETLAGSSTASRSATSRRVTACSARRS